MSENSGASRRLRASASLVAIGSCVWLFACAPRAIDSAPSIAPQVELRGSAAAVPASAENVTWPTTAWPTSTPEAQGIDSGTLADALVQIRARHIPIHSLLIERHGTIVLDSYFYPFTDNESHNVYSVTKSVTSMLVGIAMAEHRLADLNAPVMTLLPVQTTGDPRKEHITLANLLSMTSGLDCRSDGGGTLLQQMIHSPHLAAFMLNRPTDAEPGTVFDYCGGNSEVVSAVLTRTTGSSAFNFARQELFAPLGITRAAWSTDGDGVSHGWGDLRLQPRDMAKLGYLWLHNGRWENKQVVPADYLAQALTSHVDVQPGVQYGYGMWLYPGHSPVDFEANGTGGQRITVIPSLDLVEVMTGAGLDANQVAQLIARAPKSAVPLAPNPAAQARLAARVAEAAATAETTTAADVPTPPIPRAKPATAKI